MVCVFGSEHGRIFNYVLVCSSVFWVLLSVDWHNMDLGISHPPNWWWESWVFHIYEGIGPFDTAYG